jgi:hypothetical protein
MDPAADPSSVSSAAADAFAAAAAWAVKRARLDGRGDLEGVAAVGRVLARVAGGGGEVGNAAAVTLRDLKRRAARRLGGAWVRI